MSSKRVKIAKNVAAAPNLKVTVTEVLTWLYALEQAGYQVVKTEETAEYTGLRNA